MTNKYPSPIDSAKVEDTGEPVAITAEMVEAAYGPFLSVTADMVRRDSLVEVFRLAAPPANAPMTDSALLDILKRAIGTLSLHGYEGEAKAFGAEARNILLNRDES